MEWDESLKERLIEAAQRKSRKKEDDDEVRPLTLEEAESPTSSAPVKEPVLPQQTIAPPPAPANQEPNFEYTWKDRVAAAKSRHLAATAEPREVPVVVVAKEEAPASPPPKTINPSPQATEVFIKNLRQKDGVEEEQADPNADESSYTDDLELEPAAGGIQGPIKLLI